MILGLQPVLNILERLQPHLSEEQFSAYCARVEINARHAADLLTVPMRLHDRAAAHWVALRNAETDEAKREIAQQIAELLIQTI